jgi:hypothetical protein
MALHVLTSLKIASVDFAQNWELQEDHGGT